MIDNIKYGGAKTVLDLLSHQVSNSKLNLRNEVPIEILFEAQKLDLSKWSSLVDDKTLSLVYNSELPSVKYYYCKDSIKTTQKRPAITELNVSGSSKITDFGIIKLVRTFNSIVELDLSKCDSLTDNSIIEIGLCCKSLQILKLSGCKSIEGFGLVEIGHNCHELQTLDLSKCFNLHSTGLSTCLGHFLKLNNLNLSELLVVTDNEIKIMAQNCPLIERLILHECVYISDQSLLAISECCLGIRELDVSRSTMSFRITDVGLMGLGQYSKSLQVFNIHGCDHVTDVGVHWLSEGCKLLTDFDLGQCWKLTDAGLRSIGNSCQYLVSIDLSCNILISDIGLRSLAMGCKLLKHINLRGLFLLSDQKFSNWAQSSSSSSSSSLAKLKKLKTLISNPTEPIGIASLRCNCPLLQSLNVSGCFRLNMTIKHNISGFKNLLVINLSGCIDATSDALIKLSNNCVKLQHINLTDCSNAVDKASILNIVQQCKNLRSLNLTRCNSVGISVIRSISTCVKLQRLYLTGFLALTDDSLVPLSESNKLLYLKHLSLIGIKGVTDTVLAWISMKADHKIEYLALKGTSVSSLGLKVASQQFLYSELVMNSTFRGFLPLDRSSDRRYMNEYNHLKKCITALQARWRGYKDRLIASTMKDEKKRLDAVIVIQSFFRMIYSKTILWSLKLLMKQKRQAANKIVGLFRMRLAQIKLYLVRIEKRNRIRHHASILIQTNWRIHRDWTYRMKILTQRKIKQKKRLESCIQIQTIIRMYLAKQYVKKIVEMKICRRIIQLKKVLVLQRIARGYLGRIIARRERDHIKQFRISTNNMASRIQLFYRVYRLRSDIVTRIKNTQNRRTAAITIQCFIRQTLARLLYFDLKFEQLRLLKESSARQIQSIWRIFQSKVELHELRNQKYVLYATRWKAAVIIQTFIRSVQAKKILNELKAEYIEKIRCFVELEIQSVIRIQAWHRGVLGRRLFQQLLREKKGRWRELFDENRQQRFFFNQWTGEVRYRIPQDLLDLIPPSSCDNCEFYQAKMECATCDEMYCVQCFHQVHNGGRRRDHEFRCIYDYYDKRIDYGDNCYPCKWPTEIVQDEIQGWMLRVAPLRQPVIIKGNWEQYVSSDNYLFYFNRQTFETTYEVPAEWDEIVYEDDSTFATSASDVNFS